jgi:hypothetical protein
MSERPEIAMARAMAKSLHFELFESGEDSATFEIPGGVYLTIEGLRHTAWMPASDGCPWKISLEFTTFDFPVEEAWLRQRLATALKNIAEIFETRKGVR